MRAEAFNSPGANPLGNLPGWFHFCSPPATPNQSLIPDHIKLARIETLPKDAAHF